MSIDFSQDYEAPLVTSSFTPKDEGEFSLRPKRLVEYNGQEKVKERVQQGQTLMNQLMAMQQQLTELAMLVAAERGMPVNGGAPAEGGKAPTPPGGDTGKSMGSAATDAQKANMTSYGMKLAANAKPDMNA